jgi:hypothetical protein
VVANGGSGWSVEAWGKCHPTDCVWGKIKLTPIGDAVEDDSFERGFAVWEPGFASKYVEFAMEGDLLRVEVITIFKDRSRRSSFRSVEYFRRAEQRMQSNSVVKGLKGAAKGAGSVGRGENSNIGAAAVHGAIMVGAATAGAVGAVARRFPNDRFLIYAK